MLKNEKKVYRRLISITLLFYHIINPMKKKKKKMGSLEPES